MPRAWAQTTAAMMPAQHPTPEVQPAPSLVRAKRLVVKVGSSLVTNEGRGIDLDAVDTWAGQIALLRAQNRHVVLVSSGAVAEGMARLGWSERPHTVTHRHAAAAVGQMGLIQAYEAAFARHGCRTAQILLTHEDMADRRRYLNVRNTLHVLLALGVVPIVNENDTIVTDTIRLGDNDTLGALVTNLIEAEALIILTDQPGLYNADPRQVSNAQLIRVARAGDPALEAMAGGAGSRVGTGGMLSKVLAAKRAAGSGGHTVIAWGREDNILPRLAAGERIGTLLCADVPLRSARQRWLANQLHTRGRVVLDEGAVRAIRHNHRSLLAIGVVDVEGEFERGDVVACVDRAGVECGRGLINYSAGDTRRILGKPSSRIPEILGSMIDPELMHRDNMVITAA